MLKGLTAPAIKIERVVRKLSNLEDSYLFLVHDIRRLDGNFQVNKEQIESNDKVTGSLKKELSKLRFDLVEVNRKITWINMINGQQNQEPDCEIPGMYRMKEGTCGGWGSKSPCLHFELADLKQENSAIRAQLADILACLHAKESKQTKARLKQMKRDEPVNQLQKNPENKSELPTAENKSACLPGPAWKQRKLIPPLPCHNARSKPRAIQKEEYHQTGRPPPPTRGIHMPMQLQATPIPLHLDKLHFDNGLHCQILVCGHEDALWPCWPQGT